MGSSGNGGRVRSENAMPARTSSGRTTQRRPGQGRNGPGKSGKAKKSGTAKKRRPASNSRGRGRSQTARPPKTADPILILFGWVGSLLAGVWMLAGARGRRRGPGVRPHARDLDPRTAGTGSAWPPARRHRRRRDHLVAHGQPVGRVMSAVVRGGFGAAAWLVPVLLALLAWRYLRHPDGTRRPAGW